MERRNTDADHRGETQHANGGGGVKTCMEHGRVSFVTHLDINANVSGFYRVNGVHLSDIGIDLFIYNIQDAVKAVLV